MRQKFTEAIACDGGGAAGRPIKQVLVIMMRLREERGSFFFSANFAVVGGHHASDQARFAQLPTDQHVVLVGFGSKSILFKFILSADIISGLELSGA